ncbi:MAG: MMPL family transporter [Methylococcales bacterium]|nr:MMPL family transporter [Methylococcales bacterium]
MNPHKHEPEKTGEHSLVFIEQIMTFGARKPLISFLFILFISLISGVGLLNLTLDTSYDSMLSNNDPMIPVYNQVIKDFGSDNLVLIHYQADNLFTIEKLKILNEVTNTLQNLEIVENVETLATTLTIRNTHKGLKIDPLVSTPPQTQEDLAIIKDNALYSPLIRGTYLSDDGKKAALIVTLRPTFNEPEFNRNAYESIQQAIKPLEKTFDNVFQMGNPRINVEFERGIFSDLTTITPLAILVLIISIVCMLRTPMAAILPLVTSALSILWALGFLGFYGIPLNLLTAILPALVGESVVLMEIKLPQQGEPLELKPSLLFQPHWHLHQVF